MVDLIDEEIPEDSSNTEFYLGTVIAWSNAEGVKIQLDGQDSPMTKRYKMLLVTRPLPINARVIVMKHSGTYIVLGEVSLPNSRHKLDNLASDANLSTTVSKVNEIINWMVAQGMCYQ